MVTLRSTIFNGIPSPRFIMATVDAQLEDEPAVFSARSTWQLAALIALIATQLRTLIVGVPPVLPELRADLHLSFSATGALTAIPVLGLGAAAIPGAILVNRFGARRIVAAAMLGLGIAGALRLTPPMPYSLYFWTAVLSLSVAIAQPDITVLVRTWFPGRLQQVSTIYAMALGVGGLAGATLSVYLLELGGWRGTFLIWSALALSMGIVWMWLAPVRGRAGPPEPARENQCRCGRLLGADAHSRVRVLVLRTDTRRRPARPHPCRHVAVLGDHGLGDTGSRPGGHPTARS